MLMNDFAQRLYIRIYSYFHIELIRSISGQCHSPSFHSRVASEDVWGSTFPSWKPKSWCLNFSTTTNSSPIPTKTTRFSRRSVLDQNTNFWWRRPVDKNQGEQVFRYIVLLLLLLIIHHRNNIDERHIPYIQIYIQIMNYVLFEAEDVEG